MDCQNKDSAAGELIRYAMKFKKPNAFPPEIVNWVSDVRKKPLAKSLRECIISSISTIDEFEFGSVSKDVVDALDNQYFDLVEKGSKTEGKVYFRLARLALAAVEIEAGNVENAFYEYLAFVDWENLEDLISSLESNL